MKVILDQDALQIINLFQTLTGSTVMDYGIDEDVLYFVVAKGQYGLAVGKGGVKIKHAEQVFKKTIKVFEYAEDMNEFIKNLIPETLEIESKNGEVLVKVKPSDRSKVIGKAGKHIRIVNLFVQRLFDVAVVKVK
ncbi:MAG: NusA-like transcription termination signal-binding factor [Candidatus Aenigmarchaeota archaeon]|nr:NusA-like transcription termination signal-binding factor [Candidatus Aenigmarchaeota archaeon]